MKYTFNIRNRDLSLVIRPETISAITGNKRKFEFPICLFNCCENLRHDVNLYLISVMIAVFLTFYNTTFDIPDENPFENVVGIGENSGNQLFLLLPHCYLLYDGQI